MDDHRKPTQKELILELLEDRGSTGLTPGDALNEIGCFRLAARIAELRAEGHPIITTSYRTQRGAIVARYVLEQPMALVGDQLTMRLN